MGKKGRDARMNKWIFILGLGGLTTGYILFTWIFICAVLSGGRVPVDVNAYGEMNLEIVMNIILFPFVMLFLILVNKENKEG